MHHWRQDIIHDSSCTKAAIERERNENNNLQQKLKLIYFQISLFRLRFCFLFCFYLTDRHGSSSIHTLCALGLVRYQEPLTVLSHKCCFFCCIESTVTMERFVWYLIYSFSSFLIIFFWWTIWTFKCVTLGRGFYLFLHCFR